eukprot:TRINITY_DN2893_c0_g1_i2.p1 TRINITY_DN2893_c0_g1~~TRINITY_DN2893_c0_g1_i2.p1  ORF type:complete len:217 (-),score=47.65 TRINITY_DN2893_c0_g1_i2:142-792(-)
MQLEREAEKGGKLTTENQSTKDTNTLTTAKNNRTEISLLKGLLQRKKRVAAPRITQRDQVIKERNRIVREWVQISNEKNQQNELQETKDSQNKIAQLEQVIKDKDKEIHFVNTHRDQVTKEKEQLLRERDQLNNKIIELQQQLSQRVSDSVPQNAQLQRVMQFIQDLPSDDLLTIKQLGFNEINTQLLNFSNNMKKELTENRSPRSHEARPSLTIY